MQVRQAGPAVLSATGAAQDLAEGPPLGVDLPDDVREGYAGALAARHRSGDTLLRKGFPGGGRSGGGHDVRMILKVNFNFNSPLAARPIARGSGARPQWSMPEALDVSCPCCGALLKVDPETGAVVWADKKKAPAKNFDELVSRVASQRDVLEDKFARSVAQTRNQKDILEKKFEEAKKRAAADPTGRPPNPFDNE